jgi:hypothetical protein
VFRVYGLGYTNLGFTIYVLGFTFYSVPLSITFLDQGFRVLGFTRFIEYDVSCVVV